MNGHLLVPIEPMPVPRMRMTMRGGSARAYPHPRYSAWLKECGSWFERSYDGETTDQLLQVDLMMFMEKPRTGKLPSPKGDIDNMAKGPLDAANGKLWVDDSQIVELSCSKEYVPHGTPGYFVISWAEA